MNDVGRQFTPRHAIIIGGSLGGLFTAVTLRAIGWTFEIIERSPHELDSRGGGLVLQPDVLAALRFAGIRVTDAIGVPSADRIYLDRDDAVVYRNFMPQTQTSWGTLYSMMRATIPADQIHSGEEFVGFEPGHGKVRALFASGRSAVGDLLVGADGPHSTLRALLRPGSLPRYAGYVAWRGLAPERRVSERARSLLEGTFAFQQGPGHMLLEYMVPGEDGSVRPGERRWNWVWYRKVDAAALPALLLDRAGRQHSYSLPPGTAKQADTEALRADGRAMLAPAFQELMAATDDIFLQTIQDLQMDQMVFGRAILLGDAAFIPRPHTAGGSAKAAANALALALALRNDHAGIDASLREWQHQQREAGYRMTDSGIAMGQQIMSL
ncbi:2-polyprenyl-6-methoxyphenol hydroxylase-like FAD-dependent oxidoreductase [Duganella sp. 1224]|uniref:FAD binding domain-containing protein n=1 Tax=Duganella sp. 1224 TaxID=2587052 RepID=UPI0015C811B1|nr:FAD-dependent monooxygenase [Duganella sp. 1224]NYE60327.1 2-polyprenyl-6-methoxyphenol hydroxylase-like FAD-dependent oxidoreductase [Duganella sp. 1224]